MPPPPTAALSSVLQRRLGMRRHCLDGIAPLSPARCRFAGPAHTVRYLPLREDLADAFAPYNADGPFARAYEAVQPGQVVVIAAMAATRSGILGGMIALRLAKRGAAGVVCDAGMRDVDEMRGLGLPVFCAGPAPASSTTQLMLVDHGGPVACGGVTIFPGDMIVGDADGVVVCPAREFDAACAEVAEREAIEAYVQLRLQAGEPMAGLYPPTDATRAAFKAWQAAGSPRNRLIVA
jgi:regulator of RNase E activity RraA